MNRLGIIVVIIFMGSLLWAVTTGTTVQGGKLIINGGYMAIGKQVPEEIIIVSSMTGQCMGLLCTITLPE